MNNFSKDSNPFPRFRSSVLIPFLFRPNNVDRTLPEGWVSKNFLSALAETLHNPALCSGMLSGFCLPTGLASTNPRNFNARTVIKPKSYSPSS
jgi:hypothetical protein